jgi:hypothetical protein
MSTRAPRVDWTLSAGSSRPGNLDAEAANDAKPSDVSLRETVERARLLLDETEGRGVAVAPPVVQAIVRIEREIEACITPDTAALAQFVSAYEALWKVSAGESAYSLNTYAKRAQRLTWRIYFVLFAGLMLIAVPLTTISTVGGKLSRDVVAQIGSACRDYPVLYCDPATRDEETTYNHFPYAVNDLRSRTSHIVDSLWVLAIFDDVLQRTDLRNELPQISPGNDRNVWSSFLETFARSGTIIDRFQLYYGTLASYLLPIIFGMLGAVTFGLRELRRRADLANGRPRGGPMMAILRICIAGLAGYLVTVTGDIFSEVQAPAIFIAFLLGYSIDVFFALLDRAVLRIRAINTASRPKLGRG